MEEKEEMSGRLQVFKKNQLTENTLSHLPHVVSNDADSFVSFKMFVSEISVSPSIQLMGIAAVHRDYFFG